MIATKRRNQVVQNTEREKKVLKKRRSVEMAFASIKKYNRILIRKDKNISNYMGYFFMGLIDILGGGILRHLHTCILLIKNILNQLDLIFFNRYFLIAINFIILSFKLFLRK